MIEKKSKAFFKGSIITLVQNETSMNDNLVVVSGKGSDLTKTNLKFRARRKQVSQRLATALVDLAKAKGDKRKEQENWNLYHCQNVITTSKGRLYSKYCKNRNCQTCQDIRRAEIINNYLPIIKGWRQPHLITLTVQSCEAHKLEDMIKEMFEVFRKIKNKHRKRCSRGKGYEFRGVKSIECGFNVESETYNPHFHLIVENKQIGEALINDWLEMWTTNYTDRISQDIRGIKNTDKDKADTLKYICKSNIDMQEIGTKTYISALSNISDAFKGKRVFERFGFNVPKTKVRGKREDVILGNYKKWKFNFGIVDWVDEETGEIMSYHE